MENMELKKIYSSSFVNVRLSAEERAILIKLLMSRDPIPQSSRNIDIYLLTYLDSRLEV